MYDCYTVWRNSIIFKKKLQKNKKYEIIQESDKERSRKRATLQKQKSHFQHSVS